MINAIILAAGKGSRMNSELPKCAFPILGKPMINYLTDMLSKISFEKIVCVVGYKKDALMSSLDESIVCVEQPSPLGSADAVKCCKSILDSKQLSVIIPGDTPLVTKKIIEQLITLHQVNNNDLTILTIEKKNPLGFGRIIRNANNEIIEIKEETEANEEEKTINEVNSGIYCINNKILFEEIEYINNENSKKEYYLTDIVKNMASKYKIGTIKELDSFYLQGINDLKTLSLVEDELKKNIIKKHIENGVYLANSDSIVIGPDVEIAQGSRIFYRSIILGRTIIGKNCQIGPESELYNSLIKENVKCHKSVIADSQVGSYSTVGPYAHLRQNTIIGEYNRIGNYVEIKNSILGNNVNVAHLTYIGDTTCGDRVNWGCGSVTVNYDGVNKHKTVVGNNVFIGCNTNLIAPITIGDNTFIAAGSTITQNLNDGSFAIARSKQVTKDAYSFKYRTK